MTLVDPVSRDTYIQLARAGLSTLDISDMVTYSVIEFRGLGLSPLHRLSTRGPYQHGTSDRGYRLDPRPIFLLIRSQGATYGGLYEVRQALFPYLRPGLDPVSIRITYTKSDSTKVQRQIDCHVVRGLDGATADQRGWRQRDVVELIANDPTFYAPLPTVQSVSLDGGGTGFFLNDSGGSHMALNDAGGAQMTMAGGGGSASVVVTLSESNVWDTYPTIEAWGPLTGLTMTNTATGDVIAFTSSIANGDKWTVDLRYGYKTVTDSAGINQIGALSTASSLATWRFVPGGNTILVTATNTSSTSLVKFTYYQRYLGV